ncbi:MAG: chromosome partitioning protein ParB, partial [Marinirhabdus sp.]|nr:chromosome partitioning protein ParB [Marinirhabdus sp.]
IYEKILSNKLSVRDTEALVRGYKSPETSTAKPAKKSLPTYANKGRRELSDILDTKVDVKVSKSGKGQIVLPFKSKDDFNRLLSLLKSEK